MSLDKSCTEQFVTICHTKMLMLWRLFLAEVELRQEVEMRLFFSSVIGSWIIMTYIFW